MPETMINIGILVRKVFIKKIKINPIINETKLKVFITVPVLGNVKDTPKQKDKVVNPNRKEINVIAILKSSFLIMERSIA
jgi:hypothetical protein